MGQGGLQFGGTQSALTQDHGCSAMDFNSRQLVCRQAALPRWHADSACTSPFFRNWWRGRLFVQQISCPSVLNLDEPPAIISPGD